MNGEPDRAALHFALASDRNLERLLAWRRVKERAEGGGFNGLLVSDLTAAGMAIEALLDAAPTGHGIPGRKARVSGAERGSVSATCPPGPEGDTT